jgi:hypothetical protein
MNILVGSEVHYVPDILFKDGTYLDEEDYIATTLRYQKFVVEMLLKENNKKGRIKKGSDTSVRIKVAPTKSKKSSGTNTKKKSLTS